MKPIQIKLTPAQFEVFEQLRGKRDKSTFLRSLLSQEAERRGIVFPDDTPSNDLSKARLKRWPKERLNDDDPLHE